MNFEDIAETGSLRDPRKPELPHSFVSRKEFASVSPRNDRLMNRCVSVCLLAVFLPLALKGQAPSISSFTPSSGPVGTTVTISGSNFSVTPSHNKVYFGATRAAVNSAASNELSVTVPVGATYSPISVTAESLTAYSQKPFLATFTSSDQISDTSMAPKLDVSATDPYNLLVVDIDGDGKADIVVSNQFSSTVSIYRNTATSGTLTSGSFASPVSFTVGDRPVGMAFGDLDGDGKPDLAATNYNGSTVSVLRNTSTPGSISFATHVDLATPLGSGPFNVVIADLNGDGKPDLAVANDVAGTVSVFQNACVVGDITTGSFSTRVEFTVAADPFVAVADIDGDGQPDIVTANWGSNSVSILRNKGTGGSISSSSFDSKLDFGTGTNPFSISIGDLDGDGKPDLVTPNESELSQSMSVLRNTSTSGSVSFETKVDYATGFGSRFAAISDIDGDGKPDVAVCNRTGNNFVILKNTGSSGALGFNAGVSFTTGTRPRHIVAGDLDGDGKPDVVAADEGTPMGTNFISIFRNTVVVPPIVSIDSTSIPFGTQRVGTSSSSHAATLRNTGGQPLRIDSVRVNTGDYSQSNTLPISPSTLAVDSSGVVHITFTPSAVGLRSGEIRIYDNAGGSPHTISVSGTGIAPVATLYPATISFGRQRVGTTSGTRPLTLKNTGTAPLAVSSDSVSGGNFSLAGSSPPFILNPGDSSTFSVSFTPTASGDTTGSISFHDDATGNPHVVGLSGTGVQPLVQLLPAAWDFGEQRAFTASPPKVFTLKNTGNDSLRIFSIRTWGDFGETHTLPISPITLPPESSGTISVTFTPTSPGFESRGSLTVTDDAPGSPHGDSLSGLGTYSYLHAYPDSLQFTTLAVDSTERDTLTVTNEGTASLNLTVVTSVGFHVSPETAAIAPRDSFRFAVAFHPVTVGSFAGRAIFAHNGTNSPDTIPLRGSASSTITVLKLRDADGDTATKGDRSLNSWRLLLYKDSVAAASLYASADTSRLVATVTEAGRYIAAEADSGSTWTRLNGGTFDTLTVLATSISDTFINFHANFITIREYRDADGLFGTSGDRTLTPWRFEIRKDSVNGPLFTAGKGSTVLATRVPDGNFVILEADSAGWQHIGYSNGGSPTPSGVSSVSVSVHDGQGIGVDFMSFHPNTISVGAFEDGDGRFSTSGDRIPKSWHLELHRDAADGPLVTSADGPVLPAGNLPDGRFVAVESDSSGWIHLGYSLNPGASIPGGDNRVILDLANGQAMNVDFANAPPVYGQYFRTFRPENLALSRDSKGKLGKPVKPSPDKIFFSFAVRNDSDNTGGLHVEFSSRIDTTLPVVTTPASVPAALDAGLKSWNFPFPGLLHRGDSVKLSGFAKLSKLLKISKYYFTRGSSQAGAAGSIPSVHIEPRYPMPNRVNVLADLFGRGGFTSTGGMRVGRDKSVGSDSSKFYGWLLAPKYTDIMNTLRDRSGLDTGPAFGFSTYTSNGRAIIKRQKSLPPGKLNNVLVADMIALRLGIAASAFGITPRGLGELIYDDTVANGWNGRMVKEIADFGDSVMMGSYSLGRHVFSDSLLYRQLDSVIRRINAAFEGDLDTFSFGSQLQVRGTRQLLAVGILKANPSAVPAVIQPSAPGPGAFPSVYTLYQNYPNPFNPRTTIEFDLAGEAFVTLKVYNILGQEIAILADRELMGEGGQSLDFDAGTLPSGVYFYRLEVTEPSDGEEGRNFTAVKKMILLK